MPQSTWVEMEVTEASLRFTVYLPHCTSSVTLAGSLSLMRSKDKELEAPGGRLSCVGWRWCFTACKMEMVSGSFANGNSYDLTVNHSLKSM